MTSDFYQTQADKCRREAADTSLVQVRDRNLRAAAAWGVMAEKLIRTEAARAERNEKAATARDSAAADPTLAE